jgi:hypothetical protein
MRFLLEDFVEGALITFDECEPVFLDTELGAIELRGLRLN